MYAGLVAKSTFKRSCSWMRELDEMWLAQLPGSTLAWMFGMRFSRAMITWLHDQSVGEDALQHLMPDGRTH